MLLTHSSQQNWLLLIYFTTGIPRYQLNYDSTYKPTRYEVDGYTLNSNITIHLINMYAPSYSHKARHHFYKSLRHRWFRLHNIIVMGDFNNVEDEARDRMRPSPSHHTDDITTFLEFRTTHRLLDAYIEQYELEDDEPVMMTNTTNIQNGLTTHSRIDRAYYSRQIHGIVRFDDKDNIPPCAASTQGHSPIAITLLDPKSPGYTNTKRSGEWASTHSMTPLC